MIDLFAQLLEASGIGQKWFLSAVLVFLRVGAAMALMPAFGEQAVPQRVRLVVAVAFTCIVGPAVAPGMGAVDGYLRSGATEVLVGAAMRMFIFSLQIAASIIAQATSLSQMFGGATPEPQPAIGNLLIMASLALAVLAGLHVKVASLLIYSYDVFPVGRTPDTADMAEWGLYRIVQAFMFAFSLAAPFVIGSVLYNVALGIINKAMPQLSVIMVGAPLLTAASLALMVVVIPLILTIWLGQFDDFLAAPFRLTP
jgi:flagellar biosynthesis protein FliR